jgi:hypothetical protein
MTGGGWALPSCGGGRRRKEDDKIGIAGLWLFTMLLARRLDARFFNKSPAPRKFMMELGKVDASSTARKNSRQK